MLILILIDMDLSVEPSSPMAYPRSPNSASQSGWSAPPLSPLNSWDENEARRRTKLDERRRSLLAEYSGDRTPSSDSARPSSSVIPLRRTSAALGQSASPDRRSFMHSPLSSESPDRADRRASFHLKPLVLTPQRTIIVPPLTSPSVSSLSMRRRISGDQSPGMSRSDSSMSNRPLSPSGNGPSRRRSIGYIDTSMMEQSIGSASAEQVSSSGNPPRAFGHHWQANYVGDEISPGTIEVQDPFTKLGGINKGFPQLETIPDTPQMDNSTRFASEQPESVAMSRNDLSITSSLSELESSRSPSSPNFPLPPDQVPSRKSSMQSIRTAKASSPSPPPPVPVPRKKKRIPAPYDEHWNGEAFIEVDDDPPSPDAVHTPVQAPATQLGRSSDEMIDQEPTANGEATETDPVVRTAELDGDRQAIDLAARTHHPISIQPQSGRRTSANTLRKLRRPDSVAAAQGSDLGKDRRMSILSHARSFALDRMGGDPVKNERRLSKSAENLRLDRRESDVSEIWPPAENQQTKKLTAGPTLANLSAEEYFDDIDTPYFDVDDDPYLLNLDSAYGSVARRPKIVPRDPRAQIDAPDSFLGVLLTSEPPAPARDRRDTFASLFSVRSQNRWSSHSESTTETTASAPSSEYSTTADSPKKGSGRFTKKLFSFGSNKKSSSPSPSPSSKRSRPPSAYTTTTILTSAASPSPTSPTRSPKRPISIGAQSRPSILVMGPNKHSTDLHQSGLGLSASSLADSADQIALRRPSRASILQPPALEPPIEVAEDTMASEKQLLDAVLGNLPVGAANAVPALPRPPRDQPEGRWAPIAIPPGGGRRSSGASSLGPNGRIAKAAGSSRRVSADQIHIAQATAVMA